MPTVVEQVYGVPAPGTPGRKCADASYTRSISCVMMRAASVSGQSTTSTRSWQFWVINGRSALVSPIARLPIKGYSTRRQSERLKGCYRPEAVIH
jgi:hypothetical protein